jgi:hypothetical protein
MTPTGCSSPPTSALTTWSSPKTRIKFVFLPIPIYTSFHFNDRKVIMSMLTMSGYFFIISNKNFMGISVSLPSL